MGETFPLSLCLHENEMENKVDVALSGKKVFLFVKIVTFGKADDCATFTFMSVSLLVEK